MAQNFIEQVNTLAWRLPSARASYHIGLGVDLLGRVVDGHLGP
jgi:hypothetical protein